MENERIHFLPVNEVNADYDMNAVVILMKDELFLRGEKVPMTKEAVRALALSKLELHRASHLIDIGAGTGNVSIEAALQYRIARDGNRA